jgi:DNA-binding GntR family transcriptional regulator
VNPEWKPSKVDRISASLTQQVYDFLKDAIMSLELPPGSKLVESELAKALGTSVTPVREALRLLQSEGLVRLAYSRSAFVLGLSLSDIRDLYEVRALLETSAVRRSVPRLGEEDLACLECIVRETEAALECGDLAAFSEKNRRFHTELCRHAGNRYLMKLLDDMADQLHRLRVAQQKQAAKLAEEASADALRAHWNIIDAVRAGDAELAAELIHNDVSSLLKDIEAGQLDSLQLILNPGESEDAQS